MGGLLSAAPARPAPCQRHGELAGGRHSRRPCSVPDRSVYTGQRTERRVIRLPTTLLEVRTTGHQEGVKYRTGRRQRGRTTWKRPSLLTDCTDHLSSSHGWTQERRGVLLVLTLVVTLTAPSHRRHSLPDILPLHEGVIYLIVPVYIYRTPNSVLPSLYYTNHLQDRLILYTCRLLHLILYFPPHTRPHGVPHPSTPPRPVAAPPRIPGGPFPGAPHRSARHQTSAVVARVRLLHRQPGRGDDGPRAGRGLPAARPPPATLPGVGRRHDATR